MRLVKFLSLALIGIILALLIRLPAGAEIASLGQNVPRLGR